MSGPSTAASSSLRVRKAQARARGELLVSKRLRALSKTGKRLHTARRQALGLFERGPGLGRAAELEQHFAKQFVRGLVQRGRTEIHWQPTLLGRDLRERSNARFLVTLAQDA